MLPIIGTAIGALSGIAGGITNAINNKKEQKIIDEKKETLTDWYNNEMATDYVDTDAAKSTLSLLRKQNKEVSDSLNNSMFKRGVSDEAKVALSSSLNDSYADAVSAMAGQDDAHKSSIQKQYDSQLNALENKESTLKKSFGDSIASAGQYLGSGIIDLNSRGVFDKFNKDE